MNVNIASMAKKFIADESGPTAVEYAVMLGLVIMVCLVSIMLFGSNTGSSFGDSQQRMTNAGLGS